MAVMLPFSEKNCSRDYHDQEKVFYRRRRASVSGIASPSSSPELVVQPVSVVSGN